MSLINMRLFAVAILAILVAWTVCNNGAQAQVTFSKDWNPGKRTVVDNPEMHAAMKTASTICHLLINQIRQIAACESNIKGDDLDPGASTIFSGRR